MRTWLPALIAVAALTACAHDSAATTHDKTASAGTLIYLGAGKVFVLSPEGGTPKVIVDETEGGRAPGLNDGIALDVAHNAIYWTNMGKASADDGWVSRANLDGTNKYQVIEFWRRLHAETDEARSQARQDVLV